MEYINKRMWQWERRKRVYEYSVCFVKIEDHTHIKFNALIVDWNELIYMIILLFNTSKCIIYSGHTHHPMNAEMWKFNVIHDDDITQIHHCPSVCLTLFSTVSLCIICVSACLNILIICENVCVHLWAKSNQNNNRNKSREKNETS